MELSILKSLALVKPVGSIAVASAVCCSMTQPDLVPAQDPTVSSLKHHASGAGSVSEATAN